MIQQARMPFVRFTSDVKQTSDADGRSVFDTIYYANITPAGSRDEHVKEAESWIRDLKEKAMTRGPFDSAANEYDQWHERFSKAFAQFKAGEEMTTAGTPIRSSLAFSKTEVAQAESVRIYSIEDLAICNEESLQRMGIGARQLKQKAQSLIDGKSSSQHAQENAALRLKVDELNAKVEKMLAAGIPEPAKRGRKPNPEMAE